MFRYMNLFARSIGLSMLDIGLILGLNTILSLPANPLAGKHVGIFFTFPVLTLIILAFFCRIY